MSIEFTECPKCGEEQLDPNTLRCICCGYDQLTTIQEGMKNDGFFDRPDIVLCKNCQKIFVRRVYLEKYPWSSEMCRECILLVVDSPTQPR